MHIHGNQFDPNIELNTLYATVKADAKEKAEATRKKLLSAASTLASEADCVVELSGDDASKEQNDGEDRQSQGGSKKDSEQADSASTEEPFSDWA